MEEPEVVETPAEAPEVVADVPAADEWSGVAREDWERAVQFMSAAGPILEQTYHLLQAREQSQQPAPVAETPATPTLDPFDPASVQQYINSQIDQGVQQRLEAQLGHYQPILDTVAAREGEQLANQELERLTGSIGEFDRDAAFLFASGMIEQGVVPGRALEMGARAAKEFESRLKEKWAADMKALASAEPEVTPGVTGGATELEKVPTGPGRYREAVDRALARRQAVRPIG